LVCVMERLEPSSIIMLFEPLCGGKIKDCMDKI
jgi:hypothetical protein